MTAPTATAAPPIPAAGFPGAAATRKDKRKALKKLKRKQIRQEAAIKEREEEEVRSNDPEEQLRLKLREQEEAAAVERERRVFEERERILIEAAAAKRAEEEAAAAAREAEEETKGEEINVSAKFDEGDEWEYVEEGPAEIIWQGNEIIVKKKMVRAGKKSVNQNHNNEDDERPISNPLPPQSAAFTSYKTGQSVSAQDTLESVAEQVPNFGTEQDKAHCPFHLKTGACRFGTRCSRAHFYPDKSCTLLIKNMYSVLGLAWEQDERLEIFCEFVGVSRWKVAICGEYMKSSLRTCSHGTACNFIHCFRNPGGDYEWADWDNPPPKYWMKKMAFLFGPDEAGYEEQMKLEEHEGPWDSNRKSTPTNYRHHSRRSLHSERDAQYWF